MLEGVTGLTDREIEKLKGLEDTTVRISLDTVSNRVEIKEWLKTRCLT